MTLPYLHVYRAPSGEWSGKVLDEVAGIGGCDTPESVWQAASEQFPDLMDLQELAHFEALDREPGTVGDDEQGRYTRRRDDGSLEVIEKPDDNDTVSP